MDPREFLDWMPFLLCAGSVIGAGLRGRTEWAVVAGAIMIGGIAATAIAPDEAPWITLGAWVMLLAMPSVLGRFLAVAVAGQHYDRARWLSFGVAMLHPTGAWRAQPTLLRGLALTRQGRWDRAEPKLRAIAGNARYPISQLSASVQLCRWSGNWRALANTTSLADGDAFGTAVCVHALGECGRLAEMLTLFEAGDQKYRNSPAWRQAVLSVLAFSGRPDRVAALCRTVLARLPTEAVAFWVATARMAAGGTEAIAGQAEMEHLVRSSRADISRTAVLRLANPPVDASQMPEARRATSLSADAGPALKKPRAGALLARAPATLTLIGVIVVIFISENGNSLYRLGGLSMPAVLEGGQWWRLITALFLHAGPLHLGINLAGLLVLGVVAEPMFGRVRFLAIYAVSGVGSMAAVLVLMRLGWVANYLLVGASGAIMGLAGAIFAALLTRFLATGSATLARWVVSIVAVVLLQSAIDLTVPQISVAAHAAGMFLGVVIGFMPRFRQAVVLPTALNASSSALPLSRRDLMIFGFLAATFGAAFWLRSHRRRTSSAPGSRSIPGQG